MRRAASLALAMLLVVHVEVWTIAASSRADAPSGVRPGEAPTWPASAKGTPRPTLADTTAEGRSLIRRYFVPPEAKTDRRVEDETRVSSRRVRTPSIVNSQHDQVDSSAERGPAVSDDELVGAVPQLPTDGAGPVAYTSVHVETVATDEWPASTNATPSARKEPSPSHAEPAIPAASHVGPVMLPTARGQHGHEAAAAAQDTPITDDDLTSSGVADSRAASSFGPTNSGPTSSDPSDVDRAVLWTEAATLEQVLSSKLSSARQTSKSSPSFPSRIFSVGSTTRQGNARWTSTERPFTSAGRRPFRGAGSEPLAAGSEANADQFPLPSLTAGSNGDSTTTAEHESFAPIELTSATISVDDDGWPTVRDDAPTSSSFGSGWLTTGNGAVPGYGDGAIGYGSGGPMPGDAVVSDGGGEAYASDLGAVVCDDPGGLFGTGLGLLDLPRLYLDASWRHGNLWYAWDTGQSWWYKNQFFNWDAKGDRLPALLTTSPPGTPQNEMGVLGLPNTQVLFGEQSVNSGERFGGRITFGYGQFQGIHADYYSTEKDVTRFDAASLGDPILARPFFNVQTGTDASSIIAAPVVIEFGAPTNLQGEFHAEATSRAQSAGLSYRHLWWMDTNNPSNSFYRLNVLGGYRFFRLDEALNIVDVVRPVGGVFAPGTEISRWDHFSTENQFHGGEIGLLMAMHYNRWSLELMSRVGLGNMHQVVHIDGRSQTVTPQLPPLPPIIAVADNGLLAQQSNIGKHTRDRFAVIPEFSVELGFQATAHVKFLLGYNFIYVSQVARPGDQIDIAINPSQAGGGMLVGEARPRVTMGDSEFWLQGLTSGVEVKF